MRQLPLALLVLLLPLFATGAPAAGDGGPLEALRTGGHVLLVRHAQTTPGFGDPEGFRIDDCATQRNLSPEGRTQARRLGEWLRDSGVPIGQVLSSRWCRARETAELAFGRAEVWDELNYLHHRGTARRGRTGPVRRRIAAFRGPDNLVLVGHGSNILDLTGRRPPQGGMLVVAPGGAEGFRLLGALEPDAAGAGQNGAR